MRYGIFSTFGSVLLLAPVMLAACGNPEIVISPTTSGTGGEGGAGASGGAGGEGAILVGGGGGATTTTTPNDPCDGVACGVDQHCEVQGDAGTCVNNTCDELMCGPTEVCDTGPNGGAVCKDISCATDLQCPAAQFCDGTICVDDVCAPGVAECSGDVVLLCLPNGSGQEEKYTCGSDAYFTSVCSGDGMGSATCTCFDDWDCPAYTVCDVAICTGTGKAPTCSLPPEPFENVLPAIEIQWGGTGPAAPAATGRPFPNSAQNTSTPVVVNLDDDNGDGLINERDFPEILFLTFCNQDVAQNGVLRAIHGGGPNKGADYFATQGPTTWHEGDDVGLAYTCAGGTLNSTAGIAAADLDNDGVPEIVVPNENAGLSIFDNTGNLITSTANNQWSGYVNPAPAVANVDNAGFAEIVVGRHLFTLAHDANGKLTFVDRFSGNLNHGLQGQGPIPCVANLVGDERQEIVAGTTLYRWPSAPPGVTKIAECAGPYGDAELDAYCAGQLLVVWDGQTVNGSAAIPNARREGFCAVADLLGADQVAAPGPANPLDGVAEVALIAEGYLLVLNGQTGTLRRSVNLNGGQDGGAPNVDDFDGDGFPEIGSALATKYIMIDLQDTSPACPAWPNTFDDAVAGLNGNPARDPGGACSLDADCVNPGTTCNEATGSCVCLHNGWARKTEDDSSRVTGSSVFDFNGDGAAEVVYNDECYFRIYDGTTSAVLFKEHSPSPTRIEYPVVADVDNDGNAEIVFGSANSYTSCSEGVNYNNGLEVWGAQNDLWVSARRIWNEHAYHVTNVNESAILPTREAENHKPYNGRVYNTYRSNPRSYGVAPDLTVTGVQISSPDVACGELSDTLTIVAKIDNAGDLRVGPGVVVSYHGTWGGVTEPLYADAAMTPLVTTIQSSLEPGDSILLSVQYSAAFNSAGAVPDQVTVVVDEADVERECREDNNALAETVEPSMPLADLRLELGVATEGTCPTPEVETTVINDGAAAASNVVVRYYAGDPNAGGTVLHQELVAGPIEGNGGSVSFTATIPIFPDNLSILVYGIVDPDDAIPECNDGNNKDAADNKIECGQIN